MRKNFLSINIPKLPVCTTEQGVEIIKTSIKKLSDWRDIIELIPSKFKKTNTLRKSGIAGLFAASLELTREGVINIISSLCYSCNICFRITCCITHTQCYIKLVIWSKIK